MGFNQMARRRREALERQGFAAHPGHPLFDNIAVIAAVSTGASWGLLVAAGQSQMTILACHGHGPARPTGLRLDRLFDLSVGATGALCGRDDLSDPAAIPAATASDSPHIRAWACAPVVDCEGIPLGIVCVLDDTARDFSALELLALENLAELAASIAVPARRLTAAGARPAIPFPSLANPGRR